MREKDGIVKYVGIVKKLFLALSFVAIPAFMVCLVLAFSGFKPFAFVAPAVGVGYLVIYGFYAMRVSMGTVLGVEVTDKVVHLKTKRKTFTYDVKRGCVGVKIYNNRFVCIFQTQDSRDGFIFYRRVLFSKYSEEQFTRDDLRAFYPAIDEAE